MECTMSFTINEATVTDAPSIAALFTDNEEGEFERLQRGTCSLDDETDHLRDRVSESICEKRALWCVAKDDRTQEIMSVAQWDLPKTEPNGVKSEEQKATDEAEWYKKLPEGMNHKLLLEYFRKIHALRDEYRKARKGGPAYTLANIATLPKYQRQGAASALIRWTFEKADKESLNVDLETAADGAARHLYEGLGFVKVGEASFNLVEHGGSGTYTHIAMVRQPQKSAD